MIMIMKRCPFCGKEFFGSTEYERQEKIRMHVIEHHHITEKTYHEVQNALKLKQSMNEICGRMRDAIKIFSEEIDSLGRDEIATRLFSHHTIENDSFKEETDWGTEDEKSREKI